MSKSEIRERIADRQRAAIKRVMTKYGLRVLPWCRAAGITEGALRNFLSGDNDSMGANNLELLANAAKISLAELLGEEVHYRADDDLLLQATQSISAIARKRGMKLSREEEIRQAIKLYNHVIEHRRSGTDALPNEALADLILHQRVV